MVEAMLMLLHGPESHTSIRGRHEFRSLPRIGEHITALDSDDVGQVYRVVDVQHPAQPAETACDIFLVHVGKLNDHLAGLGR